MGPNNLKKCMKLTWNFLRGVRKKSHLWGRHGYFLELNTIKLWL